MNEPLKTPMERTCSGTTEQHHIFIPLSIAVLSTKREISLCYRGWTLENIQDMKWRRQKLVMGEHNRKLR